MTKKIPNTKNKKWKRYQIIHKFLIANLPCTIMEKYLLFILLCNIIPSVTIKYIDIII